MSLIERAMSQQKKPATPPPVPAEGEKQNLHLSTIERAVALQQSEALVLPVAGAATAKEAPILASTPAAAAPLPSDEAGSAGIARIAIDKLRAGGMVTPDGANLEVTAEFRIIKRPLLENAFARHNTGMRRANTVMITSAVPGEGKSFCAINLAMSLAMEPDHNVILVDADVHRCTVMHELGIETQLRNAKGLVDLLLDPSLPLEEAIYRTDVDKLSVLPFGRFHARSTELFGSRVMQDRIDMLCARYPQSMIVIDCPPILATTEARVLATMLGQVVLVVEAEHTLRNHVKEALGYIENANIVGTILNKNRNKSAHDYYSDYYRTAA